MATVIPNGHLAHYGIGGMKWGIRRYQNLDGTLTAEGKRRYGSSTRGKAKMYTQAIRSQTNMQRTAMEQQKKQRDSQNARTQRKEDLETSRTEDNSSRIDRKIRRIDKQITKGAQKIMSDQTVIDNSKEIVNELIRDAMKNNYTVDSKDVTRGKNIIMRILGHTPTTVTEHKVKTTRYSM